VKHIGDRIQELDQNIRLRNADAATTGGYTRVPNFVLESGVISPGAKLAYAMLLRYAWQNDFCFPGQERLAGDMGVAKRSVITYLKELEQANFIEIERRGQGKSNIYELNMLAPRRAKKQ